MLQPGTIPSTPEEIAMSLNQLTENERYMVKGIIIGMTERAQVPGGNLMNGVSAPEHGQGQG